MKPDELRDLMLYAPRTEETYRKLPPEAGGVWWSHPDDGGFAQGKTFMHLRVGLLVAVSVYLLFFHKDIGEARVLPFVIAAYEFAYYGTWREKAKLEQFLAEQRYRDRVGELLAKLFSGYRPPLDS